ncbi:MAG: hypothetical protein WBA66_12830, partial [Xanthobacteraceae bacterium]
AVDWLVEAPTSRAKRIPGKPSSAQWRRVRYTRSATAGATGFPFGVLPGQFSILILSQYVMKIEALPLRSNLKRHCPSEQ